MSAYSIFIVQAFQILFISINSLYQAASEILFPHHFYDGGNKKRVKADRMKC